MMLAIISETYKKEPYRVGILCMALLQRPCMMWMLADNRVWH